MKMLKKERTIKYKWLHLGLRLPPYPMVVFTMAISNIQIVIAIATVTLIKRVKKFARLSNKFFNFLGIAVGRDLPWILRIAIVIWYDIRDGNKTIRSMRKHVWNWFLRRHPHPLKCNKRNSQVQGVWLYLFKVELQSLQCTWIVWNVSNNILRSIWKITSQRN